MKAATLIIVCLFMSGCVTNTPATSLADEPVPVKCKMEKPTGSNRPVKVCRVAADAIDRENTRRDMGVLQRQSDILSAPPD